MKRMFVYLLLGLLSLVLVLPTGVGTKTVTAAPPDEPYGAYTEKADFDRAVKHFKDKGIAKQAIDPVQHDLELKAIEEAFDRVDKNDLAAQDKLAKQYKLVIYRPNAKKEHTLGTTAQPGTVGTMSVESDLTMDLPYVSWSPTTNEVGINGVASWNDVSIAVEDGFWGFGGADAFSIAINGISTKTAVKRQSLRTYNSAGAETNYKTTYMFTPLQNNVWPVTIRWQDAGGSSTSFNSAEISMWVWTYGLTSPVEVASVYAHDWRTVELESIGFEASITASKSSEAQFGLMWNWKFGTDAWAGESNTVGF